MAAVQSVQMNVRMERSLKEEGDAALAEVGLTPSAAVRALWQKLARRGEELDAAVRFLSEPAAAIGVAEPDEVLECGSHIVSEGLHELGVPLLYADEIETSDAELLERALLDRYAQRGLL